MHFFKRELVGMISLINAVSNLIFKKLIISHSIAVCQQIIPVCFRCAEPQLSRERRGGLPLGGDPRVLVSFLKLIRLWHLLKKTFILFNKYTNKYSKKHDHSKKRN